MTRLPFVSVALLAIAIGVPPAPAGASVACDGAPRTDTRSPAAWRELFAYDAAAPLDVQVASTVRMPAAVVQDVTFVPRPDRPAERLAAYIVAPATPGASMPAVVWVHWLGEPATTNRTEFLAEATALAARGVVSVLVDAMWSTPRWYRNRVLEEDSATSIGQVVSLRRSLDLVLAQPGVDRGRVALVGHDYGAMYGAIVAGVDGRAKTHVLIAATASLLDWAFFYGKKPVSMETYRREHDALSLCDHLATADKVSFFFQFAEKDEYVTLAKAQALFDAANGREADVGVRRRRARDDRAGGHPSQIAPRGWLGNWESGARSASGALSAGDAAALSLGAAARRAGSMRARSLCGLADRRRGIRRFSSGANSLNTLAPACPTTAIAANRAASGPGPSSRGYQARAIIAPPAAPATSGTLGTARPRRSRV